MPVITVYKDKTKAGTKDKPALGGHWSKNQRAEAVQAFIALGRNSLVAATTGIPEGTIKNWRLKQWWKDLEDEFRRSNKLELSGKLSKVINKTIIALEDRVENGDFTYDFRTKEYIRKPITAHTANQITKDLIDRQSILEKDALKEKITDEGLDLRLQKLKEEMIKFAKTKVNPSEVIDVTPTLIEGTNA